MRYFLCSILWLTVSFAAFAQHDMPMPAKTTPVTIVEGVGHQHHRVSTASAAELNPNLAMAWWGVAECIGPNYNDPASEAWKTADVTLKVEEL